MRAFLAATVLIGAFGLTSTKAAQPDEKQKDDTKKPLTKIEVLDRRIAYATFNTVRFGIALWDQKNYEGCYRLYQGFLVGIVHSLDHRPKLVEKVIEHLRLAEPLDPVKGALELRKALDEIQRETSAGPEVVAKPLWDRLGGEKAVRAIVKDALVEMRNDKDLDFTRDGKYPPLKDEDFAAIEQGLVELLSENTGGPLKYMGPRVTMLVIGTKITEKEFTAINLHFFKAIAKQDLPKAEADALIAILARYKDVIVDK